jgi:hypothetical protein
MAQARLGTEFQVNTYTPGGQSDPSVAIADNGDFLIVWGSWGAGDPDDGVFGQWFTRTGARRGSEFQVNSYTTHHQGSTAAATNGDTVMVLWQSWGQDGPRYAIFGQAFAVDGSRVGVEFQVDSSSMRDDRLPVVAPNGPDGFVALWTGWDGRSGVFGQRLTSSGSRIGDEFQITDGVTGPHTAATDVVSDAAGNFVTIWVGEGSPYPRALARRFDSQGVRIGGEFQVNATGGPNWPRAAMSPTGDFVVVWSSLTLGGGLRDIFGQRFDSSGQRRGQEFQVNTYSAYEQMLPAVGTDDTGNFVVLWSTAEINGITLRGQRMSDTGSALGAEFHVSSHTTGDHRPPQVAMNASGSFVVAWTQWHDWDGSASGIFAQRLDFAPAPQEPIGRAVDFYRDGYVDLLWYNRASGSVYLWTMRRAEAETFAPVATVADLHWRLTASGDFNGDGKADLIWRNDASGQVYLWTMDGAVAVGNAPVATVTGGHWQIAASGDTDGDGKSDLLWHNQSTGQVYIWKMSGSVIVSVTHVATVAELDWRIIGARDLSGDGRADLLWRHRSTGEVYLWTMNGSAAVATQPVAVVADLNWDVAACGDTDGDGKADLVWYSQSTGQVYVWQMDGASIRASAPLPQVWDLDWHVALSGDVDGDDKVDLVWYNRRTGAVYAWLLNGAALQSVSAVGTVSDPTWTLPVLR